jgi:hypothetical protein
MPIMPAPESGVTVRMYRQGHGDCFLLAFRKDDGDPFYLLIDCGYKPGSKVHASIQEIVDDIHESTGGRLDVVLVTHEHQDHVNGFWEKVAANEIARFDDFDVGQLWLSWTEDPEDDFANDLRERFGDELLGLVAASRRLAAAGGAERALAERIDQWLELESGDLGASPFAIDGWSNKRAIQYVKDKCPASPTYLRPFEQVYSLPEVEGVRIYALGPPRNEELLLSLDPIGGEGYVHHLAAIAQADSFYAAAMDHGGGDFAAYAGDRIAAEQPFGRRWRIPEDERAASPQATFFADHLDGEANAWRRIDHDWLRTAETLALRLNGEVNNTSAVIAIELAQTGRVLLFVGDAQRGNWISWDDGTWPGGDGAEGTELTTEELVGRTVFYKVGHHGSHNATLKGLAGSDYPSLGWLARGDLAEEFVAMIPANERWANDVAHWTHPLPSIRDALMRKARGRVFQTDIDRVEKRATISQAEWEEFQGRIVETDLYFEYTVTDS